MFEQLLQEVGLSPNEAKIYECLLNQSSANISTIAAKSKVHRRNVYDCINKLIEKGLISQLILEKEKHFKAVSPKRLLDLLKDKEDLITEKLPLMQQRFQALPGGEQAIVYKGVTGYKNYMQDILDHCKDGEIMYVINGRGGWWDERYTPLRKRLYSEFKRRKIVGYHLFDFDMKNRNPELSKSHPCKFLPKQFATNSAIDIFADRVVSYTGLDYNRIEDDITLFVMVSKPLAESYKNWFRMIWNLIPDKKQKNF